MSDYSYSEIKNMQERAMERVREMNRNSQTALEAAKRELELGEKPPERKKEAVSPSIKPHITNMPPNFPKERTAQNLKKSEEIKIQSEKNKGLLDSIINEPDRALILGLLMLLKSEGADEALMLALTYIMT